jgi:thiol-disulfide isomerase/thioredoxin
LNNRAELLFLMRFLLTGFLLVSWCASAQQYEQTLKRCIKNFQDGMATIPREDVEGEVQRRYSVLSECIKGQKFPAFALPTHKGSRIDSKDLKGKVVLINMWITKSPTSVAAITYLNELHDEYKDKDFVLLSFSPDGFAVLSAFLKEHPINYHIFEKSRDLINHQFSTVLGYPTNIFLNKKGEVVEYRVGGSIVADELVKTKEEFKRIIEGELEK